MTAGTPKLALDNLMFDLDGTIIDSKRIFLESFHTVLGAKDIPVENEEVMDYLGMGMKLPRIMRRLVPLEMQRTPEIVEGLVLAYRKHYGARCVEESLPYPGALDALKEFRDRGKGLALCTSKMRQFAVEILDGKGVLELFDEVVCGDDVAHEKPHPEPVLRIVDARGWDPDRTLFTGDTVADIIAGRAAEVHTCGVVCGFGRGSDLANAGPDLLAEHIRDLLNIVE